MTDETKNDETPEETVVEETPVAEETPAVEETPAAEGAPEAEKVSDTEVVEAELEAEAAVSDTAAPEAEKVSDTEVVEAASEPAEAVSDTEVPDTAAVSDTSEAPAPAPVVKPSRSQRHVPRSLRRTRTKVVREQPKTRKPITRTEKPEGERGRRQERRGVVVSEKGDKTIIVKVDVIKSHPKYKKVIRSTVKFHAHDEANTAGVGDTVRIVETRPLSKLKHWRLAEILEKAK
jgi:small subunit ribosomal protein S17